MILVAWLTSCLFALPQSFVFRVLKHPQIDFLQCTSMDFFAELMGADTNHTEAEAEATVLGITPAVVEKLYSCIFLAAVYMFPLLVIIITYANILLKIIRKKKEGTNNSASINGHRNGRLELHHFSGQALHNRRAAQLSDSGGSNR